MKHSLCLASHLEEWKIKSCLSTKDDFTGSIGGNTCRRSWSIQWEQPGSTQNFDSYTILSVWFHFCYFDKLPRHKVTWGRSGYFSFQFQVIVHHCRGITQWELKAASRTISSVRGKMKWMYASLVFRQLFLFSYSSGLLNQGVQHPAFRLGLLM